MSSHVGSISPSKTFNTRVGKVDKKEITLSNYLKQCSTDPTLYSSPSERILKAIGEPKIVDTKNYPRLSRIHGNKKIKVSPSFKELNTPLLAAILILFPIVI